jgi:hypothetical protein
MDETTKPRAPAVSVKEAHAERVARAMRENLRKRKAQERAREDASKPPRDG